ncbi:MAG: hypothetical protein KCHDKBKB_00685 [Elusimicrobia bacterium]|nr:hypothetical protein [Elusimicrobiota bacterium]
MIIKFIVNGHKIEITQDRSGSTWERVDGKTSYSINAELVRDGKIIQHRRSLGRLLADIIEYYQNN